MNNYDIILSKYNELYYKIEATARIQSAIKKFFSLRAPGFIFNPLYKNGIWDGFISLVKNGLIPVGLLPDLEKYADSNGWTVFKANYRSDVGISNEYLDELIDSEVLTDVDKKTKQKFNITLRDYQKEAIRLCIKNQKQLIVSQTSSGKTLMTYMVVRILQKAILFDRKMLIIVPSVTLVEQMYNDFKNYSIDNKWDVSKHCTKLHGKSVPDYDKQILITTWQSLTEKPEKFFKDFECVIVDEAHKLGLSNTSKPKEIEVEVNKCVNARYLLGFTGTLPDEILYKKKITGFFGNVNMVTTYQDSMAAGNISNLKINVLKLNYTTGKSKAEYKEEKAFIIGSQYRNNFIKKLLLKVKGNKLLLFVDIKKHAQVIFESIKEDDRFKNQKIILLTSQSTIEERENAKTILETNDNVIVFGTYALLGTGWSVNNIWNVIFASPLKSKISILQSIGRGLRLIKGVDKVCQVWDIVDKFEYKNILYKHFLEREKYYVDNKFDYHIINFEKPKLTTLTDGNIFEI